MSNLISRAITKNINNPTLASYVSDFSVLLTIILASIIVSIITENTILKFIKKYIKKTENKLDDIMLDSGVFHTLTKVMPAFVLYSGATKFPNNQEWMQRFIVIYIIVIIGIALYQLVESINLIYQQYEVSNTKPIKGYLQVVQIFIIVICIITIISVIIDKSPIILLSGLGAATAVFMLIFQDSILGLVASIQLTANDMIRIGEWIQMDKHGADGEVIDMSLHTVKVQNWDKTIVTIPTYSLMSNSFKNWRGMQNAGGRRIMRSIYIDIPSVKFCDNSMIKRFKEIDYIKQYIVKKQLEINEYNKFKNKNSIVNQRNLTNIGTFREYIKRYISNHPEVNQNMIQIVRQLEPTAKGLPIEIYIFSNTTEFAKHEQIQADIFDHILSIVTEFDLRLYQDPSGYDVNNINENL